VAERSIDFIGPRIGCAIVEVVRRFRPEESNRATPLLYLLYRPRSESQEQICKPGNRRKVKLDATKAQALIFAKSGHVKLEFQRIATQVQFAAQPCARANP
jgi:hypothetical protein